MSRNNSSSLSNPPLFIGENYSMWSVKMKVFLKGNSVWDSVDNGFHLPHIANNPTVAQLKNHSEYVEKAYHALSHIHSGVVDSLFPRITGAETTKEAWDTLKNEFEGDTRVKGNNVITLKRQVEMLKMSEDETIHQYSTKLQDLVNRIKANGGEFPDKKVVEKIMVSVPNKFESKTSTIEETCDLDTMTVNELISKLKTHEQRLNLKGQVAATEACQLEKLHRQAFLVNQAWRATEKLELVHTIICGLMKIVSLNSNKYFMLFIDDFTGMTWVYFLSNKNQVFSMFKKFKALVENQSGCKIKTLSNVPNVKRTKLDQKGNVGTFVGYATQSKGCRVYDVHSKKKDDVDGTRIANSNLNGRIADTKDHSPIFKTKSLEEIYEQCSFTIDEPSNYAEPSKHEEWRNAMQEELIAIEKNGTWSLTPKPKDKNAIGVKWVYKSKLNADGSLNKHKARLVVKGYAQQPQVDFGETFSLVARHDTIRLLLALATQKKWKVCHSDVKFAFFNGFLEKELYVEQPKEQGFQRSETEFTLYAKGGNLDSQLLVSLYVNDVLVTRGNTKLQKFKASIQNEIEMTDLGEMKYFLGMEVMQCSNEIFVSQEKYAKDTLKKFRMDKCKPIATPLTQNLKLSKEDDSLKCNTSFY
ncbi:hypothetical protein SLEP1_g3199 [Rubroshorea leprosula]|uniref:Uncharacterized protein n=1 Tax=Rubroshorea leprosula TaxID=152421 RepID=A0AAV5HSV1_9ROSI|nr:hypothetical protein SLEP1_g3199 [Rubroshorea leprosula]